MDREIAATPDAAHAGLRTELEAVADALRRGPRATAGDQGEFLYRGTH